MTWTPDGPQGFESDKIAAIAVPYLQGRALDIGCGMRKVWPGLIGIDTGHHFGKGAADIDGDGTNLALFADRSVDAVFSSHCLEHIDRSKVPAVLREWARVLRNGGRLVLYVPNSNDYPKVGAPGANPDHRWDIYPGDVERILREECSDTCGWNLLESEVRSGGNEYSLFIVAEKLPEAGVWHESVWERNPGGKKRALVIRYGAIGDQFIAASILPLLREQGYHVTYNTTPDAADLVRHDPHIDEFLIQGKDFVPNLQLGPYWDGLRERYDHVVNLCESVEGALLALPGRLNHQYAPETRRRIVGQVNYLERTHDIAGVPYRFNQRFYPTEGEARWARAVRRQMSGPVVAWAISGSSPHKVYPFIQVVIQWLLERTPAHIVLIADGGLGKQLQDGILGALPDGFDKARVHAMAGEWPIRNALAFCQVVDAMVGPETGPMNAVAMEAVPKVIYLSHSSHANLTKHWLNTLVLEPEGVACFPCHQLHYDFAHCPRVPETAAAACASSIPPERIFEALALSLGAEKAA